MSAGSKEGRALQVLTRVVSDSPFRARELIDRVCVGTREAFGFKRVDWLPPDGLVPVAVEGSLNPTRQISRCCRAGQSRGCGREGA